MSQASKPRPKVTRLSDVTEEPVEWLWPGRVPLGKLTLGSGDPGLGKSFVTIDMAARVTTGAAWPDCPGEINPVGSVVLVSCEDGLGDTVVPRLKRAGGNPSKVIALEGVETIGSDGQMISRPFNLTDGMAILDQVLAENPDTRLVIVDPVGAYGGRTDSHRDNEVRAMLAPLGELAARYRVAVVMIAHMAKGKNSNPLYKSMASIAYIAASRAAWLFFKDQDDPERRLILLGKLNIAKEPMGLAYRLIDGRVSWESDPVELTAAEYLAKEDQGRRKSQTGYSDLPPASEVERAKQFILRSIAAGRVASDELEANASTFDINPSAMKRARSELKRDNIAKAKPVGRAWYVEMVAPLDTHEPLEPLDRLEPLDSLQSKLGLGEEEIAWAES
ncbi:MAG: AAA family ATPase [Planctomycetaceae bacterium]